MNPVIRKKLDASLFIMDAIRIEGLSMTKKTALLVSPLATRGRELERGGYCHSEERSDE